MTKVNLRPAEYRDEPNAKIYVIDNSVVTIHKGAGTWHMVHIVTWRVGGGMWRIQLA